MKVSFVQGCDHIGSLMRALKRNVHDVWCTCSFKAAGWLGRCASSLRRWPRVAHQPKQPSSSSWQHFFSLLLVWFAGDMKFERPSKDDEQHCRCVVREEKTVLQSLDVAFSAPSRKSSFLRVLLSCEGGRRLALLQGDSRVGRARIRKILALTE